jgi:hypothetical protein
MAVSPESLYTVAYGLVSACFVCPPTEFINAGLTVQTLLASWLGSEQLDFIKYHIRRTTATLVCHGLLPLGLYISAVLNSLVLSEHSVLVFVTVLPA